MIRTMAYKDKEKQRQAQHESYLRNKDRVLKRTSKRTERIRNLVKSMKEGQPCMDCGIEWPSFVLDYHHRNPKTKVANVRKMIAERRSLEAVLAEIAKCDLICSNCHRIREHLPC